ncbi:hypothetical protein [Brucella intermedia]|uniref:hypothetical protein n=1 Tax=Brucella intermedia TaxID=94625 RepID=UPI00236260B6|nr:hypothetical protein [Brucella intermedia]
MDTRTIDERLLIAGKEYGNALEKLGLDPHALLWVFDEVEDRFVLILITDFFDLKGPLEISRQLLKAYNASVTPKEIDPFTVRVHSVNQPFGNEIHNIAAADFRINIFDKNMRPKPGTENARISGWTSNGTEIRLEWVISVKKNTHRKSTELSRRWDRFTRNIDQLAA